MIIGCSLGDLCIRKQPKGINARLEFLQGLINESYILHLYNLFKDFPLHFLENLIFYEINEQIKYILI